MVERSGLVAVRASRAEAQGMCSRSPFQLLRPVPIGKSNSLLRSESAVFRRQWAENRKGATPSARIRLRSVLSVAQMAAKRGRFSVDGLDFLMSARTAIRHGFKRVLKTVVDGARSYRWSDAAPLAGWLCVFISRCPGWDLQRSAVTNLSACSMADDGVA